MSVKMVEMSTKTVGPVRSAGILQQNRVFLDFFWDLAKPDQEVRLKAIEDLIQYLKANNKASLHCHRKNLIRNALFGNFFGVLALQQSGRLSKVSVHHNLCMCCIQIVQNCDCFLIKRHFCWLSCCKVLKKSDLMLCLCYLLFCKLHHWSLSYLLLFLQEPQVVLGCVQLLQSLSQHRQHLRDLPNKTMMDILNEVSLAVFEEVLLSALQADLAAAFRTPEQLQLLLVALQRFPQTLKPQKLKKLLGSSTIINTDNIPKLTQMLNTAAQSSKKDHVLPAVALDLLKLSLKEGSFQLFWNHTIVKGMLKEQQGPAHYLCFRLLGSSLPYLSIAQLKEVLRGEVMMHYGEHVVSAQKPDRFKLAPEMEVYVSDFLQGCQDPDKQLAVMVSFSSLTNQGYPVVPSVWRVVQHLQPVALQQYVAWLKKMFLQPQQDELLDISTHKQKGNQEGKEQKENSVFRLRKWLVARLSSIIDNYQVKRQEDLIMDVARFVFFHAFFTTKKPSADIPETNNKLSVPLDDGTRGEVGEGASVNSKRVLGVTADGTMWIYHLVQYAQVLLKQPKHVECSQPFSPEQRQAWDRWELLDIMKDLQSCVDKAQEKKAKKKKKQTAAQQEEEPEWVEVMVDILLSLLSQPSRHIRQVCKTVFSSICPNVTPAALNAILDVLDPEKDDEENSAVVITDDTKSLKKEDEDDEEMEDDDDAMEDDEEEELEEGVVDQNFRLELMKVLQQQNALAEDASSDEDLDDEAMMELDKNLAAVFLEQKKKTQAKKDEKTKIMKEKTLVRDFKIKVLDFVEVLVGRQAGSPLVLSLVEPLLHIIERGMSSDSQQQEQDFLRRAADIFRNQLCRSKVYCKTVGDRQGALHDMLEKLMSKTQKLADSSVSLYYFSASLYVVKVLRGAPPAGTQQENSTTAADVSSHAFLSQL
uniref:MYB binding protein (P160) 1a n=1 Tax=Takifugu rubripes TaxID=31033 RepID=A0A674PP98_TAKRU